MTRTRVAVANPNSVDTASAHLQAAVSDLETRAGGDDDGSERVLIDFDIGGRRYLLVRLCPLPARVHSLNLSPREVEIVRLVAEGHPNKVIAAVLDISAWTVCTHVRRVFGKLGVTSRAAMVARLVEAQRSDTSFPYALARRDVRAHRPRANAQPNATEHSLPSGREASTPLPRSHASRQLARER